MFLGGRISLASSPAMKEESVPLRDLETLRLSVNNPDSCEWFGEAIRCYEAGSYRASVVSLWITLVLDLTAKLRSLAEGGDGEAKQLVERYDRAIKNREDSKALEYERNILKKVREKFELITAREFDELKRLQEDRDLCAHPNTGENGELLVPDAELVRAHIVSVWRAVLSQKPCSGKMTLEIFEGEIASASWVERSEYLEKRFFENSRSSVKRSIIKRLVKYSLGTSVVSEMISRRAIIAASQARDMIPDLFEECFKTVLDNWDSQGKMNDSVLIRFAGVYGEKETLWRLVPDTVRERAVVAVKSRGIEDLVKDGYFTGLQPIDGDLQDTNRSLIQKLGVEQLSTVLEWAIDIRPFADQAISLLNTANSFKEARESLKTLEKCASVLDENHIKKLTDVICSNGQVRGTWSLEGCLCGLYNSMHHNAETYSQWKVLVEQLNILFPEEEEARFQELSELINNGAIEN